jgi:hypothetical protein
MKRKKKNISVHSQRFRVLLCAPESIVFSVRVLFSFKSIEFYTTAVENFAF